MDVQLSESVGPNGAAGALVGEAQQPPENKGRNKKRSGDAPTREKRRCVSTACIACRRRKSKCDGNLPSCAACASVYGTECIYDPGSDHRRKGVYKRDIDNLKTKNTTLQTLIHGILNYPESEVFDLVRQIRNCENLEDVADSILRRDVALSKEDDFQEAFGYDSNTATPSLEKEMSIKMGELQLEDGSVRYIGGTSNLLFLGPRYDDAASDASGSEVNELDDPVTSWTTVTDDPDFIVHLINMYFTWHYPYFTTLSKNLFYRDFLLGRTHQESRRSTVYCTPLLVNVMLALGCHFTSALAARDIPDDPRTAGDHFFREAKRLIMEGDEHERPRLATVQALALMSVREAGCGREAKGWVYSGMSFRMALDIGLNLSSSGIIRADSSGLDEQEMDARRITLWGCFLFDKCWSNYLGRMPQLPVSVITAPRFDVFPDEDSDTWSPYTDEGVSMTNAQPARTRTVALQILSLCEISSDIIMTFYNPQNVEKGTSRSSEVRKLSELHTRLEAWSKNLPKELEARDGALPPVLIMHMFFHLLYIHLFRPFLKYSSSTSPLPSTVSPRKVCTQAASHISRILRMYKRTYGLRQICNISVYIMHSACVIHILNVPEKNAVRDIVYGFKHLEEIAEGWLCASRSIDILGKLSAKWKRTLPPEVMAVLAKNEILFGQTWNERRDKPKDRRSPRNDAIQSPTTMSLNLPAPTAGRRRSPTTEEILNEMQARYQASIFASSIPPSLKQIKVPEEVFTGRTNTTPGSMVPLSPTLVSNAPLSNPSAKLEQLTNDAGEWWLRDQVSVEMGFGNWSGLDFEAHLNSEVSAANGIPSFPVMSAQDSAFISNLFKQSQQQRQAQERNSGDTRMSQPPFSPVTRGNEWYQDR